MFICAGCRIYGPISLSWLHDISTSDIIIEINISRQSPSMIFISGLGMDPMIPKQQKNCWRKINNKWLKIEFFEDRIKTFRLYKTGVNELFVYLLVSNISSSPRVCITSRTNETRWCCVWPISSILTTHHSTTQLISPLTHAAETLWRVQIKWLLPYICGRIWGEAMMTMRSKGQDVCVTTVQE